MPKNLRIAVAVGLMSLCLLACVSSQEKQLTASEKDSIVQQAGRLLIDRYVFPDVGELCAKHLASRLATGAFDSVSGREGFARMLTEELFSIAHDKHLRIRMRVRTEPSPEAEDPFSLAYRQRELARERNFGFVKAEVLDGNVGTVDIRWFPPIEAARPTASAALKFVSHVDALIIDLRQNGGGSPGTIQYICSYFFAERTHLNSLYWREGNRTEEFWTLDDVDGQKMPDIPLYVLISGRTFSGGEEFAYNLKTRKRATIIGQTTGGGANPGGGFPLPAGLSIFVPMGRAINPVTGTNWEGVGVEPDIPCPADEALALAQEKAVAAARQYREHRNQSATEAIKTLKSELENAEGLYAKGELREGESATRSSLTKALSEELVDEAGINDLGYLLLREKKLDLAIGVFHVNVECFPGSWNTYDSLAEAYMTKGENERAIEYYKKSLELNPANEGARQNIKKMGGRY